MIFSKRAKIAKNSRPSNAEHHSSGGSQVTARPPGVMCVTAMCYVIIFKYNTSFPAMLAVDIRSWTFLASSAHVTLTGQRNNVSDVIICRYIKQRAAFVRPLKQKPLHLEIKAALHCCCSDLQITGNKRRVTNQFFSPPHRILFSSSRFLCSLSLVSLLYEPCPSLLPPSPASFYLVCSCNVSVRFLSSLL